MQEFPYVDILVSHHKVYISSVVMDFGLKNRRKQKSLLLMLKHSIKPDVLQLFLKKYLLNLLQK